MCVALGVEVPGHRKEQLTQTLIVHLLKTHLFLALQKLEGPAPQPLAPLASFHAFTRILGSISGGRYRFFCSSLYLCEIKTASYI